MAIEVLSRKTFIASPSEGTAVHASTYYTTKDSLGLMSIHGYETRSDTCDASFIRFSGDNGRSWSPAQEVSPTFEDPRGTGRRYVRGGDVDPITGRYVTIINYSVLPTDDPLEGMRQWRLYYTVSEDGGRTDLFDEQIICEGEEFDAEHPMPDVFVGRNCVMIGDNGQRVITRSDGALLLPVQSSVLGPDGKLFNPGGGYTYTDCALLIGRWKPDKRIAWEASERVKADPARSSRGLIEPTLAELTDGSLIMVMRGSNDRIPDVPGHKWVSRSRDGGLTWTEAVPWTYTDGEAFFSPSAMSQLVPLADGRLFWAGNISKENARGNSPRYPIVLGEVDRETGLLIRDTVTALDDLRPGESPHLTLSNFYIRQDREDGDLRLFMTRLFANDFREKGRIDWTADALVYRVSV